MFSFNFNGQDSYTDFGLVVEKRPFIPKPERNIQYIEVPGRSGSLKVDDTTYKDILIPIQCRFKDEQVPEHADLIKPWLDSGEGQLILSNQPDKYYLALVSEQVDINQELQAFGKFLVNFRCRPFKYAIDNGVISLTVPGSITNPGTVTSEPILLITGDGDITLTINGLDIQLTGVSGSITLDSVLKDAYKDTLLQNSLMNGDFPVFVPGENTISWMGAVTSVLITPFWRWL